MAGVSLAMAFYLVLQKNLSFRVLRSFELQNFLRRNIQRLKKYFVYFKTDGFCYGEKDAFKTV